MTQPAGNPHHATKLSVNLSGATAHAFRELIRRRGITITDGVRRAIRIWEFLERETEAGNTIAVVKPNGATKKITLID